MAIVGTSWGRYPGANQRIVSVHDRAVSLPEFDSTALPHGNGRSYGDTCTNDGGTLLHARALDRFISFYPATGVLRCEAGVLLSEILDLVVPQGWFLPVSPGTKFVTVGGAIANDVHGKNHHRTGCFGSHVRALELLRSDGSRSICSPTASADWFSATVAGLGLTGLITWAELQLSRVASAGVITDTMRFSTIREFLALSRESEKDYEFTVAWVDCAAKGRALGRGIFMRANHAPAMHGKPRRSQHYLRVPFSPPFSLINRWSLGAFNRAYYRGHRTTQKSALQHYDPFLYPLDSIADWNRIYGPRGFLQYQCVIPPTHAEEAVTELLRRVSEGNTGSFLTVLKMFGDRPSPGILSFPRPGTTLALDFPNHGPSTLALLERLDDVVSAAGGAVYPAKDARMRSDRFRQYFPDWSKMLPFIDPRFSSGFWRRVMEQ